MSAIVETPATAPAWRNYTRWPEVIERVPPGTEIGDLRSDIHAAYLTATERRALATRLQTKVDAYALLLDTATHATSWQQVSEAQSMTPILQREIEHLRSEAAALDEQTDPLRQRLTTLWETYAKALDRWRKRPTPQNEDELAALVWPRH